VGAIIPIVFLVIIIVVIAGAWKMFTKAEKPGWGVLVPIYNIILMLEIAGRPLWWFILLLIPFVNLIIAIIVNIDIAKKFGKGVGFGIGMVFLGVIFIPILGFGDAQYQGAGAAPSVEWKSDMPDTPERPGSRDRPDRSLKKMRRDRPERRTRTEKADDEDARDTPERPRRFGRFRKERTQPEVIAEWELDPYEVIKVEPRKKVKGKKAVLLGLLVICIIIIAFPDSQAIFIKIGQTSIA